MLFDILISMLTGLYSGLIASKYIRFVHIRSQSIQIVKQTEHLHGHGDEKVGMLRRRDMEHLDALIKDLSDLGYVDAASIIREIEQTLRTAEKEKHAPEVVNEEIHTWIKKMQHCHPAILPTLMAWRI